MLVQVQNLGRSIGDRWLFRAANLTLRKGDRVGIVGPNGAGKSTLLRVIAGDESQDEGEINRVRGTVLGMLKQEVNPSLTHSVQEEASAALASIEELERKLRDLEGQITEVGTQGKEIPAALAESYDTASTRYQHLGGFQREAQVARVLSGLGFDEEARLRPLRSFSGGWLMRIELAKLFLSQPDIMLLDEPTNHLDLPSIAFFEEEMKAFRGALVIVSHDRTFLSRHVGRVVDLDGSGGFTLYEKSYPDFLRERAERQAQLLARKATQDREIAQMERFVRRFRAKASKAKQAQSRVKALEKIDRIVADEPGKRRMRLQIPPPARSGEEVISLGGIHKAYGDAPIYQGIDLLIPRGDRVALVGPNGAGKSTLLRIIAGVLDFESGERRLGHNVQLAFFAQHQLDALEPGLSILQELERSAQLNDISRLRGHLGAFLFSGDDVDKKIGVLSGGEKARVALAKLLLRPSNFLVLDEPTNHLDIPSREILENALKQYSGTLIFVSHDRSFINELTRRVIEVKDGVLREFIGNYDDYLYRLTAQGAPPKTSPGLDESAPKSAPRAQDKPRAASSKAERQAERERRRNRDRIARKISKIETAIQEKETEKEAKTWQLGDPKFYSDADRVAQIQAEQDELTSTIDGLYVEWERLNDELMALDDLLRPN